MARPSGHTWRLQPAIGVCANSEPHVYAHVYNLATCLCSYPDTFVHIPTHIFELVSKHMHATVGIGKADGVSGGGIGVRQVGTGVCAQVR